jgi:DNA primase
MIDIAQIHQMTDLLTLIGHDTTLKRVASTKGGEYAGPCPFCGGHDRFRVWPSSDRPGWWCRQCERNGDAIAYVMQRDALDFRAACERLGVSMPGKPRPRPAVHPDSNGAPSGTWQGRGRDFVAYCQGRLWGGAGAKALAWLQGRGLHAETIHYFGLGYNPARIDDEPQRWGLEGGKKVWLPRGVVIPCEVAGVLWYVKIRRPEGGRWKYVQARGSRTALFGADDLGNENRLLLLCEGEFDAMLAKQEVGDLVDVAALCGASKGIPARWLPYLIPHPRVLVAYDGDDAGREGAKKLAAQSKRIVKIDLADGGDLTDFYTSGGDLRGLLAGEVARHTPNPADPLVQAAQALGGKVVEVETPDGTVEMPF